MTIPTPGAITKGLTEYIFCCWVCNWREVIHATDKPGAIRLAKDAGWFMSFGKWRCGSHVCKPVESEAPQ